MKAMILAAGLGERLRPLTRHVPKALVPVAGRPMIDYPLSLLRRAGIEEVIVNLHHLGDQIEDYLGDGARFGLSIRYSREERLLDTGGGVLNARAFLEGSSFFVINTDVLIDVELADVIAFHNRHKAVATLVLRSDEKAEEYGAIECTHDGRVHRFLDARLSTVPQPALIKRMFTGVQILKPEVFAYMDGGEPFSLTRTTYVRLLRAGQPLYGFDYSGFWRDLGTVESIREVEDYFRSTGLNHNKEVKGK
jgi:mannose-1-phosphate guanylyltransferase/phosphomannomutase